MSQRHNFVMKMFEHLFKKKMVNPSNGPAAKLLTTLTLNLVKMNITGHHMVIQSLLNEFILIIEPGNHFPGTRKSFSGNQEVIFREPGNHFPGTGKSISREMTFHFPGTGKSLILIMMIC